MKSNESVQPETEQYEFTIREEGPEPSAINSKEFYCLDGGFASHLPTHYKQTVENDPLWSCRALHKDPEAVIKTHKDFVEAGADIVTTNTYQATGEHLRKHLGKDMIDPIIGPHVLLEDAAKLARRGVQSAGKVGGKPFVAGSVGPYGACLCDGSEYNGNYLKPGHPSSKSLGADKRAIREYLRNWHRDRIKRLHLGGADVHAVETMPGSLEPLAILDVLEEFPGTKAWISFQCQEGGRTTASGEPIEDAFRALHRHRSFKFKIIAVGANCVNPRDVSEILTRFNNVNNWKEWPDVLHYNKMPYIVYPNAGRQWDGNSKSWMDHNSESFDGCKEILENIGLWMRLGANIIGGCCQIGPEMIRRISKTITLEMFDTLQARMREEEQNSNPDEEWSSVLQRLEKPSDDRVKRGKNNEEEERLVFVFDIS